MASHVLIDPDPFGPYDTCANCGQPVRGDATRGLVTILTNNAECYGKAER